MSARPATHGIFTIRRTLDAPVALVFRTWSDKAHKARWFKGPAGWTEEIRERNFRVGGRDRLRGRWDAQSRAWRTSDFNAVYFDIVADSRIVYVYEMAIDGVKISVSLATVTFAALDGGRTQLTVTEQGTFLDGYEDGDRREEGVAAQIDMLAESLKGRRPEG
ncbi:MAG TPA: SRPBCC domain-containing protein [Rhizomicrobium sp.]|nr:SRPBCC domain-containing protein [Rhizomicrobium sp.]